MSIQERQEQFIKGLEGLSKHTGITMTVQNQSEQLNNGVIQIRATIALVQVEGWTELSQDDIAHTQDIHWAEGKGPTRDNTPR